MVVLLLVSVLLVTYFSVINAHSLNHSRTNIHTPSSTPHPTQAVSAGKKLVTKLKDVLDRQQFEITLQAKIGAKVRLVANSLCTVHFSLLFVSSLLSPSLLYLHSFFCIFFQYFSFILSSIIIFIFSIFISSIL
jgi:GTP-binding protein LepA C-terminus